MIREREFSKYSGLNLFDGQQRDGTIERLVDQLIYGGKK
jgi:hypothetical protein